MAISSKTGKYVPKPIKGSKKLLTSMNMVLIFQDGELIRQIVYPNKTIARNEFLTFKKYGFMDYRTGKTIDNVTFQLL